MYMKWYHNVVRFLTYSPLSALRRLPFSCIVYFHLLLLIRIQPTLLHSSLDPSDVLLHVLPIQLCRLCVSWTIWIWIVQQTLDRCEDRCDIVRRRPAILEDVKAELAVRIHVWMEHS